MEKRQIRVCAMGYNAADEPDMMFFRYFMTDEDIENEEHIDMAAEEAESNDFTAKMIFDETESLYSRLFSDE